MLGFESLDDDIGDPFRRRAPPPLPCLLACAFSSQIVHGGMTALTFDNLFGMALFLANAGSVFTAFIKVRRTRKHPHDHIISYTKYGVGETPTPPPQKKKIGIICTYTHRRGSGFELSYTSMSIGTQLRCPLQDAWLQFSVLYGFICQAGIYVGRRLSNKLFGQVTTIFWCILRSQQETRARGGGKLSADFPDERFNHTRSAVLLLVYELLQQQAKLI